MAKIINMFTREVMYEEESILTEKVKVNLTLVGKTKDEQPALSVQQYVDIYMDYIRSVDIRMPEKSPNRR